MNTPYTFPCGLTIHNRICKPAMSESVALRSGCPSEELIHLYKVWGEQGGAGLIVTGNVMVDHRRLTEPRNAILEDEKFLPEFARMAKASKSGGGLAIVQVSHPGRVGSIPLIGTPVGPSEVAVDLPVVKFRKPRALTVPEIEDIIVRFARTSELAVKAGFDGVQIHGAHGYLVSQFLSPIANIRNDEYGGDASRRMTFLLRIVRETRKRIGNDKILSVKLNSADFQKGGFSEEDSLVVIKELEKAGVDLLEISGGNYESPVMTGVVKPSSQKREAYFLEFASKVRAISKIPLMLSGGVRTLDFANQVIRSNEVDVIGIARPYAIAPNAGARLLESGTLNDLPELQRSGIDLIDAYLQVAWHQLMMTDIAFNRKPGNGSLNPYVSFFRASSAMTFKSLTQFRENDVKWGLLLLVIFMLFLKRRGFL